MVGGVMLVEGLTAHVSEAPKHRGQEGKGSGSAPQCGQEVLPGSSPRRASIQMGRGKVTVVPQCRVSYLKSGPVV